MVQEKMALLGLVPTVWGSAEGDSLTAQPSAERGRHSPAPDLTTEHRLCGQPETPGLCWQHLLGEVEAPCGHRRQTDVREEL